MFSKITKLTWMIRLFGLSKVAMIAYCRPSVISFDKNKLEIKESKKIHNYIIKNMSLDILHTNLESIFNQNE